MTRPLRVVAPEDAYPALREALAGGPAVFVGSAADLPERVEQRIALVVETSGSAGAPKRVALSADALLASAAASESALGGPGQWVLALPTHYIAGINVLTRSLAAGLDPVPVAGSRFTATGFAEAARRLEVPERYTALVPPQLATLLDDPDATAELQRFRAVLVGGQATPVPLRERASASGVRIVRTYGSSETSGGCVYDGAPIGQTVVRIEDGEVWLGGPTLAEGYLGDPARTAERFVVADGLHWFRTADAGEWDGERLQITGRRDDVLISGGIKVAPGAVERVLHGVPGFADAVVVGVPDARWGQVPVAITAGTGDDQTAVDAVGAALGNPARPARIIHLDALPLLPSGKPDRVALASLAARGRDDTAR